MKMAAAEALYDTEEPAAFSILTIGTLDGSEEKFSIKIPNLLSFLAEGDPGAEVVGINDLREEYQKTYGSDPGATYYSPGDYTPNIPLTYWSFRLMIGLGLAAAAAAARILVATRRPRTPTGPAIRWTALAVPFLPLFANSFGWIFTEAGRQPWAVFGLMTTDRAVSPGVSTFEVVASLSLFTLLYSVLAFIEVRLMLTYIRRGADPIDHRPPTDDPNSTDEGDRPLAFAY
jgi:cytochrome d ubiquinol oxidase subunit I